MSTTDKGERRERNVARERSVGRERSMGGTELDRLQRWMQAAITYPGGILSVTGNEEAAGSGDLDLYTVEDVLLPSATLSGAERLAIYCRSYHSRLLQCFQSMFPALARALGQELFNGFALDYLQRHPPRSYTLDQLADNFPQHLSETRPDALAPPSERERWPDFIIELASLEWAFLKTYDGPGVEGRKLPSPEDVMALSDERLLTARPLPVSCLQVFAFRYPVHNYLLAARRDEEPSLPAPAESFVAMTRRSYRVMIYELSSAQYQFIRALDGLQNLAHALSRAAEPVDRRQPFIGEVREWLCDWTAKGFFESVEAPQAAGMA